jgi:hypothetical protein
LPLVGKLALAILLLLLDAHAAFQLLAQSIGFALRRNESAVGVALPLQTIQLIARLINDSPGAAVERVLDLVPDARRRGGGLVEDRSRWRRRRDRRRAAERRGKQSAGEHPSHDAHTLHVQIICRLRCPQRRIRR